jgi:putative ATPase
MNQKGLWGVEQVPVKSLLSIPPESPLPLRMSPRDFSEYVGQEHLVGEGRALRRAIEQDKLFSMLFWGPPGTGKTALARLIAYMTRSLFMVLSAVNSGVKDIRRVVETASEALKENKATILFIDEIHRFNKGQQDALLPYVENGTVVLIGATTENPYFGINAALLSRLRIFKFNHLSEDDIKALIERALADQERGLAYSIEKKQDIILEDKAMRHIIAFSGGDARIALNVLEALYNSASDGGGKVILTLDKAMDITQSPSILYDRTGDQHYDVISAYIKSMRGSDPHAAVYWLARMLEAGEDPRFVARRLVICAAEDVGNADPMALVLSEAAFRAVEHIGMPECRIPLAQATIYVATAPKSNAACVAIDEAIKDVREKPSYPVPLHLRGTGYSGAARLGHGSSYKYPHDFPGGYVEQQYLPDALMGKKYYKPPKDRK